MRRKPSQNSNWNADRHSSDNDSGQHVSIGPWAGMSRANALAPLRLLHPGNPPRASRPRFLIRRRLDRRRDRRPRTRSSGSARSSSRPRGRTSGSAPGRTATSRRSAPTRAAGSSTATTTAGASIATARSSTDARLRARAAAAARDAPAAHLRGRGRRASACSQAQFACSTAASSGSAARTTRRRTRPTAWRRCGSGTCTLEPGNVIVFDYAAKGGKRRVQSIVDPQVYRLVAELKRRRGGGEELLAYKEDGRWHDIRSSDINEYIKEVDGRRLHREGLPHLDRRRCSPRWRSRSPGGRASRTARKRAITRAVKEVAHYLGNTPAVCRASYIDPRVFDRYAAGVTIARRAGHARRRRPRRAGDPGRGRGGGDRAARRLTESRSWIARRSSCSKETRPGQELLEEALRVLAPDVVGVALELPRFDLSLENRRETQEPGRP